MWKSSSTMDMESVMVKPN